MRLSPLLLPVFFSLPLDVFAAVVFETEEVQAEIYGRVEFNVHNEIGKAQGIGSSRLGFKGRSKVTDNLQAIVRGEWEMVAENSGHNQEFNLEDGQLDCADVNEFTACTVSGVIRADTSKSLTSRHVYAGFEIGEYGQLIFGQTETAFYDALASTDIFNSFGFEGLDVIYVGRQEGQMIYTADLKDIHVSGSYQFYNSSATLQLGGSEGSGVVSGGKGTDIELKNAFATTIGYNFNFGLSVFAAYSQENYAGAKKSNWAGSFNYAHEDVYMALVIANSDVNDSNLRGLEAVLGYDYSPILLYAGYNGQDGDNISVNNQSSGSYSGMTANTWLFGSQFDFNAHFIAWFEYKLENTKDFSEQGDKDDIWSVAIQYNF